MKTAVTHKAALGRLVPWLAGVTLGFGLLFGASSASAAPPPANTVIGNQASASYADTSGNIQQATSNKVETLVQQVGSFNLDGGTTYNNLAAPWLQNTKTGAAGATVYAPHVVNNTGNGTDVFNIKVDTTTTPAAFSKVEVFADANGDGLPDSTTPICTVTPGTPCEVLNQSIPGNGSFGFVVAYSIPATATAPAHDGSGQSVGVQDRRGLHGL